MNRLANLILIVCLSLAACSKVKTTGLPKEGATVRLKGSSELTFVATDEKSLEDFEKAQSTKNENFAYKLIGEKRILLVPNGTEVKVLQTGLAVKIHILEGEHADKIVWTDLAWIDLNNTSEKR